MEYNKLVSVTGLTGLFELVSSKADGGVVRSLEDNTTKFVSNRIHQFSHLESIEIYTTADNVNLVDVLTAMKSSAEKLPDASDAKAVKSYSTIDFVRVYGSDMKKMVKWFDVIKKNNIEIKLSEAGENVAQENMVAKTKPTETKTASIKNNAPAKKINSPRKMA